MHVIATMLSKQYSNVARWSIADLGLKRIDRRLHWATRSACWHCAAPITVLAICRPSRPQLHCRRTINGFQR